MKKLFMVILCLMLVSPAFASANNGKEKGENNGHKNFAVEEKNDRKEFKSFKKDDDERHYAGTASTTATTTPPVQMAKKINYFLCKTDAGWNVVPLEGVRGANSANALGKACMKLPHGFAKRYYGVPATTTPDIVAPVISFATASSIAPTSATISWTTNEMANGNVYVSTSTPVNVATAVTQGTSTLSTIHTFSFIGLTPSTTYYYMVKSADSANNSAVSGVLSFVTPAVADTTVPVISAITTSGIASTTATVSWTTNEPATGKLLYGTSTPLTLFMSTTTLSTAHSFTLSGLMASTTYSLILESSDAAGNTSSTASSVYTTI